MRTHREMQRDAVTLTPGPYPSFLMIPLPCLHSYFFCFSFYFMECLWIFFFFCNILTLYFSILLNSLNSPSHAQLMPLMGYHYYMQLPTRPFFIFFFLSCYNRKITSLPVLIIPSVCPLKYLLFHLLLTLFQIWPFYQLLPISISTWLYFIYIKNQIDKNLASFITPWSFLLTALIIFPLYSQT